MDSERFDALTRRLATERPSRRRLLRGLGGSLGGAVLASLGIQAADANSDGNMRCAAYCQRAFPPGPARGQCISDGARGKGPCHLLGSGCRTPPCCYGPGSPCFNPWDCCSGTCSNDSGYGGFCA